MFFQRELCQTLGAPTADILLGDGLDRGVRLLGGLRRMAVLGVLIAVCRVVTGVHYISDVLAGLAFGAVFAVLGWNAFVLAASAMGFYSIMLL